MTTAFGPQSPNYTTVRPPVDTVVSTSDTWFKDCSSAALKDGTLIDASWFNVILAQLRTAVRNARPRTGPIVMADTTDTMLSQAIQSYGNAFTPAAAAPTTGFEAVGDIWYDTTDGSTNMYCSDGTTFSWMQVS
jgi:hypothetical protein